MEIVERVALCFDKMRTSDDGRALCVRLTDRDMMRLARAAIAEVLDWLGEPSEGMMGAARGGGPHDDRGNPLGDYEIDGILYAMLTQARKEGLGE